MFRFAAFRIPAAVGFHFQLPGSYHKTTIKDFSEQLNTEPASSIHQASDSRYRGCPQISLLTCWLRFGQVGLELLLEFTHWLTITNFFPHSGIPKVVDLPRHDRKHLKLSYMIPDQGLPEDIFSC